MKSFIGRALAMMAAYPALLAMFCATTLMQLAYKVGQAFCAQVIFDDGIRDGNGRALGIALAVLVALLIIFSVGSMVQEKIMARLGTLIGNGLRRRLFDKQLWVSPRFHRQHTPSDLVDRMGNDVGSIELALVRGVPPVLLDLTIASVCIVLLFAIEWRLAAIVLLTVPLTMVVSQPFRRLASSEFHSASEANAKVLALTAEAATAYLPLRLFYGQHRIGRRFADLTTELGRVSSRGHFYIGAASRSAQTASGIIAVIVIGFGGWLALEGYLTAGLVFAFISLLTNIGDAIGRISVAMPVISDGAKSSGRIDALLAEPDDTADPPNAQTISGISQEIRFDRISFAYPDGEPVLRDVSFAIGAGKVVALVGASGSGKSTAIGLLTRLYRPTSGTITLDGVPLQEVTEASLRRLITAVPQTPTLFRGTIRENVAIGNPEAPPEEITADLKAAGLAGTIADLPEGWDTEVGDGGSLLSGGQRQRVAIARAFLRRAPILLLDETTSALDAASEAIVNRSITALRGRHTVLAVTHRIDGLDKFDEILVFDRGRLVERGSHAELLAVDGVYHRLWSRVQGIAVDEEGIGAAVTADRLGQFEFFAGCNRETIETMAGLFLSERIPEQRDVMRQGDQGEKFYVIARGKVEVVHEPRGAAPVRLAVLSDGDFFGEVALVSDVPRTATIRTLTDCWFLTLHRQQFRSLLEREPGLRDRIETVIASRMADQAAAFTHALDTRTGAAALAAS